MASRRAPSQIVHQVFQAIERNEEADRVLIPDYWFETDAYGAAVAGILKSIQLGLKSGSLGQGVEEDTLRRVLGVLLEEDTMIKREDWMA